MTSRFDWNPEQLDLQSVHTPCLFRWQNRDALLFIGTPQRANARANEPIHTVAAAGRGCACPPCWMLAIPFAHRGL